LIVAMAADERAGTATTARRHWLHGETVSRASSAVTVNLSGPVAVELAKAVEQLPGPHALPGGCVYEPKWDGYLH
jgi:ATP-dependent DNA ligase